MQELCQVQESQAWGGGASAHGQKSSFTRCKLREDTVLCILGSKQGHDFSKCGLVFDFLSRLSVTSHHCCRHGAGEVGEVIHLDPQAAGSDHVPHCVA